MLLNFFRRTNSTMKVFGYSKISDTLLELKEVSIQCNLEDLDKIISFLQEVNNKHSNINCDVDLCHSHFRDWDKKWNNDSSDIIIVTN